MREAREAKIGQRDRWAGVLQDHVKLRGWRV